VKKCARCPSTAKGFAILEVRLQFYAYIAPHEWLCAEHLREVDPTEVLFKDGHHYSFQSPTRRVDLTLFEEAYGGCRLRAPGIFEEEEKEGRTIRVILGLSKLTEDEVASLLAHWERTSTGLAQPNIEIVNARDIASS